ncbi:Chaperone SurA [subsurface metagenome]|nr:hypothetical protein [bacterium]
MLKAMRKNVKSLAPALWLVIIAFIITIFAVWGGAGRLGEAPATSTIAKVKNEKISADYYYQNLIQRLEMLSNEFQDINKNLIQQLNIPQQVLEEIIQQTILLQKAKELGITASPEELRDRIMNYPVFQQDGKFVGFDVYKRILELNRIPVSEFEEGVRKDIITNKVIQVLTAGIAVTPEELWESYKNKNESVQMEYVAAEADKMELEEEPSLSEIREYFDQNREKYKIPERREASVVFFRTEDIKREIELNDSASPSRFSLLSSSLIFLTFSAASTSPMKTKSRNSSRLRAVASLRESGIVKILARSHKLTPRIPKRWAEEIGAFMNGEPFRLSNRKK